VFGSLKEREKQNKFCMDCRSAQTTWGSATLGVFLCMNCAGIHRGLGTHLTFIRSIDLDQWNNKQLLIMMVGGNKRAQEYISDVAPYMENAEPSVKYGSKALADYREMLKNEAAKIYAELPPELTQSSSSSNSNNTNTTSGNAALRGFSDATAISSSDLFPEEKRQKKRTCCC